MTVPGSSDVVPNPLASGYAMLRYSPPGTGPASVTVYDVAGRPIRRQTVTAAKAGEVRLDLRDLAGGVYIVRLDGETFSAAQKLVVRR